MSEQAAEQSGASGDVVVRAVLRSDVGLVRSENQDYGAFTTATEEEGAQPGGRLMVVADGMGGHRGGATASRLAVETLKAHYLASGGPDIAGSLHAALTHANERVWSEAQANPDLRGMGTTTSALVIRGTQAFWAHVGDSRIYLVRGDAIRQLTDDHSLVASMVREGLLTQEEADNHPRRNVLQRSVGVAEHVEVDVRGPLELRAGDTFVICSDGLHGLVKEPEIKEIARLPIREAAELYVQRALERGAPDNVTVVVARVERADGAPPEDPQADQETVRFDPIVFDDTAREPPPESTAPPKPAPAAAGEPKPSAPSMTNEPALPAAGKKPQAGSQRLYLLLSVLVGVALLGAAAWWLFWSR